MVNIITGFKLKSRTLWFLRCEIEYQDSWPFPVNHSHLWVFQ